MTIKSNYQNITILFAATIGLLCALFSAQAGDRPRGWHIVNTTATQVGVSWYETATERTKASFSLFNLFRTPPEVAVGDKTRLSKPVIIKSGRSHFIPRINKIADKTRYQLFMTQSPRLLRKTLEADENGWAQASTKLHAGVGLDNITRWLY